MIKSDLNNKKYFNIISLVVLVLPCIWLIVTALILDIDYYDGYDAICNAGCLSGNGYAFRPNRVPMMSLILIPARELGRMIGLQPANLVLYHLTLAILHSLYLIGVFVIIKRLYGKTIAVPIAFAASVLSFIFFSYGAFISHDILPGILLILMLILYHRILKEGRLIDYILISIIGLIAVLIKYTFGIFWMSIIVVNIINLFSPSSGKISDKISVTLKICLAGFCSAILFWLIMGWVLDGTFPETNFFLRPIEQIRYKMTTYTNRDVVFPIWVYFANLRFYGLLTIILIVPGIILSFRKGGLFRDASIILLFCFTYMHLINFKEVRYLAYLIPLSALIIVLPINIILQSNKWIQLICGALLTVDLSSAGIEAVRLFNGFYTSSQYSQLLSPLFNGRYNGRKVFMYPFFLNSIPPYKTPFIGDPFHRLFHISPVHIREFTQRDITYLNDPRKLQNLACAFPDSVLIFSNRFIHHSSNYKESIHKLFQTLAVSEKLDFVRVGTGEYAVNGTKARLRKCIIDGKTSYVFTCESDNLFKQYLFPCIIDKKSNCHPIFNIKHGIYLIGNLNNQKNPAPDGWSIMGYKSLTTSSYNSEYKQTIVTR